MALAAALVGSNASQAQIPLGPEIRVNTQGEFVQGFPAVAIANDGKFLVTWGGAVAGDVPDDLHRKFGLWAQWYSPLGKPIGHNLLLQAKEMQFWAARVAPGAKGGALVAWQQKRNESFGFWDDLVTGELLPDGTWAVPPAKRTFLNNLRPRLLALTPQGKYLLTLIGFQGRDPAPFVRTFLLSLDGNQRLLTGPATVYPARKEDQYVSGLAVSPSGEFLVSWTESNVPVVGAEVYAQRFSANARPLAPAQRLNEQRVPLQFDAPVAPLADRGYVAVWEQDDERALSRLKMRLLAPDGTFRSGELFVDDLNTFRGYQVVASDPQGNFIVVWQEASSETGFDIWGRLFRPDGTPAGPRVRLNTFTENAQTEPEVAFGKNGTFVAIWRSAGQDGDEEGIFGQVFSASPGGEICGLGGSKLRCDLGRTGGEAELEIRLAGRPGAKTAVGDRDGDGRADRCTFESGAWACDLDHFGAPAEETLQFGQEGDEPLLGDLDGDGKAEACIRRAGHLLCQEAGGVLDRDYGLAGEPAWLADVDGDHRAEVCVVRDGVFLCDAGHDGGAFEWQDRFGRPGAPAGFGDVDGDGKAEPCTWEAGEVRCDTARDGGAPEFSIRFPRRPGEGLVITNLDGL